MANFDQYDNLRETFTTTGTGTITVVGSPGGAYRAFSAKLANGYVGIFYARNGTSLGNATQWERWIGTYSTSGTITRTTRLDSSTGSWINWEAGTKIVEISPAPSRVLEAASGYTVSTNSATGGQTLSITSGGGDALTSNNLDQFADVTQTSGKTLAITENTTLAGGSHSGTNTGDQNTFSTIAVSGQSNVVADSTGDTLTLVAGSNITITTNAGGDSITIAASGGGGGDVASDVIWDAKGDLAVGTGSNTAANLAVGSNGQVLSADSGESTGLKWVTLNTDTQNNLLLPATTDTVGQIKWNGAVGIHAYGSDNFFANGVTGSPAGNFSLTGSSNVGISAYSLSSLTSGGMNIGIGPGALRSCETTGGCVAIGTSTLGEYVGSGACVAIGVNALASLVSGTQNVSIGNESLYDATTCQNVVGIGYFALNANTTGSNNTACGAICFRDNVTGENNTGLGYGAGVENETGSNQTCLGYLAGPTTTALENITAVGANASVTADNTLVLGDSATGVAIGATAAEECALLTLASTSRGLLLPRMSTTQRDAISDPINGLVIHNTTTETLDAYQENGWQTITASAGGDVTLAGTQTLTNKRITKRVQTVVTDSGVTPDADDDDIVDITALAEPVGIANPSGTPTNGQVLLIRILDDGTSRAITWGSDYAACGTTLPTETLPDKHLVCLFVFNGMNALDKWQLLSVKQEV